MSDSIPDVMTWITLAGPLLLVMALSSTLVRTLPISITVLYLGLGVLLGPLALDWLDVDLRGADAWLAPLTEVAVVMSLFIGGLKLRLPLRHAAWTPAVRLAFPAMVLCIVGVAAFTHLVLGLALPLALLVGAVLAPTDPVLASSVAVSDAREEDRVRYGLSGEAGINDGMAFPFVLLALLLAEHGHPGRWLVDWALTRLLWAVPVGLALGFALGLGVGRLAIALRSRHGDARAPSDLLALALVAMSYAAAEQVGAWGFLSTFAAGVGLPRAEMRAVVPPHPQALPEASEHTVGAIVSDEAVKEPAVAAGTLVAQTLSFGETVERLLELVLVVVVGVSLARYWDARAIPLAAFAYVLVRPLAAMLCLVRTDTSSKERLLLGWFGIRGIGSLFYLCYAMRHGLAPRDADTATALTVSCVALSVVVHGISATPLLARFAPSSVR